MRQRTVGDGDDELSMESVDALLVEIGRMVDDGAASDIWRRHHRGERNSNIANRLYATHQGRRAFEEMRKRYNFEPETRQMVDRYIAAFDQMVGEIDVTTEPGKIYTLLAHASGRLD